MLTACNKTGNSTSSDSSITASTVTTEVKELGNEEFRKLVGEPQADGKHWKFASDKPIIIDFYATWCGPCQAMAPMLQRLAQEYEGRIKVLKVDVDKNQALATAANIMSIPTLFFIRKDGTIERKVGGMPYQELVKKAEGVM